MTMMRVPENDRTFEQEIAEVTEVAEERRVRAAVKKILTLSQHAANRELRSMNATDRKWKRRMVPSIGGRRFGFGRPP
jgi:uncharacterized protein (DUF305 family)